MGHALNSKTLSGEIGVSRTPVREALRRLEAKGLVEIVPHFGAYVRSLRMDDFIEVAAMRKALEGFLAGTAAQVRTDADLREISSVVDSMRRLTEELTTSEKEEALFKALGHEDIRFHVAILSAARNKFIAGEVLRLHLISRVALGGAPVIPPKSDNLKTERKARDERRRFVLAAHEDILQAILDRNRMLARDLMESHIQDVVDLHVAKVGLEGRRDEKPLLTEEEEIYVTG